MESERQRERGTADVAKDEEKVNRERRHGRLIPMSARIPKRNDTITEPRALARRPAARRSFFSSRLGWEALPHCEPQMGMPDDSR